MTKYSDISSCSRYHLLVSHALQRLGVQKAKITRVDDCRCFVDTNQTVELVVCAQMSGKKEVTRLTVAADIRHAEDACRRTCKDYAGSMLGCRADRLRGRHDTIGIRNSRGHDTRGILWGRESIGIACSNAFAMPMSITERVNERETQSNNNTRGDHQHTPLIIISGSKYSSSDPDFVAAMTATLVSRLSLSLSRSLSLYQNAEYLI